MDSLAVFPSQVKAGRALADLTQAQLARAAGVGLTFLKEFEAGIRPLRAEMLASLRAALEDRGVILIAPDGGGPGARLRTWEGGAIKAAAALVDA